MSNILKNNYQKIVKILLFITLLFLLPISLEMVFKAGNIVGSLIRIYSSTCI